MRVVCEGRGEESVQLDLVYLRFLGHDVFDVRFEPRVCLEDFGAYAALNGRFDLGLCAGLDAVGGRKS